ncbi:MAG: hypothetical protein ABIJ42_07840 [Acidobacteriota bacterium]
MPLSLVQNVQHTMFSEKDRRKMIEENSCEPHRHREFQDELRELLDKHNLKYDERYLWS